jgi:hypothetical protein
MWDHAKEHVKLGNVEEYVKDRVVKVPGLALRVSPAGEALARFVGIHRAHLDREFFLSWVSVTDQFLRSRVRFCSPTRTLSRKAGGVG